MIMTYLRTVTNNQIKKEQSTPTHISLFTGCGGFDLGLAQAGFESRVMVEWDKACCETLRANWHWEELKNRTDHKGKTIWKTKEEMKKTIRHYHNREPVILEEDITQLSTQRILEAGDLQVGEATLVTGGCPCQGFSMSGKRIIKDPRNKLFKEFVRVVREALPKMLVFENVPGLVSIAKGDIMKQICEEFAGCGYDIAWEILNAADYGVPQNRRRVFLVGQRIDLMNITEEGRMQLHMGATPGQILHPKKFREKHKIPDPTQTTMEDHKHPENLMDLLQQLRKGISTNSTLC